MPRRVRRISMGYGRKLRLPALEGIADQELVVEVPGGLVRIITGPWAGATAHPCVRVEVSANGTRYADQVPTWAHTVHDKTGSTTVVSAGRSPQVTNRRHVKGA